MSSCLPADQRWLVPHVEDRAHGLQPFCVVGNAATINTPLGTIDAALYGTRRSNLVDQLERVYGELDGENNAAYAALVDEREQAAALLLEQQQDNKRKADTTMATEMEVERAVVRRTATSSPGMGTMRWTRNFP